MFQSSPSIGDSIQSNLVAFTEKFTDIPAGWLPKIACHAIPLPIWGTVFLVANRDHQATIKAAFRRIENDTEDNLSDYWFAVGDTGFVAIKIDEHIFLGVDGAGYCFFTSHWEPLREIIYSS
jgi:hypothetical protein